MIDILFATTNEGKFKELLVEVGDLPFRFLSLKDVGITQEVDEPFETTEQNAIHKARAYAKMSSMITLAEDTGFFVRALKGEPGTKAHRYAATAEERINKILNALKGFPQHKRRAYFEASACLYNPKTDGFTVFKGLVNGLITNKTVGSNGPGMTYDTIFYYPELKKTFSQLNEREKNMVSHRGKVINQLHLYLLRNYSFKQLLVPIAFVVRNRKLLLLKRRDHRPSLNNKWEFPGGGVENGETVEDCVVRETKEESGFEVRIVRQLPGLPTFVRRYTEDPFQIFLVPFIVSIKRGSLKISPHEATAAKWFTLAEALRADQFPLNKKVIRQNLKLLKDFID